MLSRISALIVAVVACFTLSADQAIGRTAPVNAFVCGHIFTSGCSGPGAHKVQGPSGDGYQTLHGECLVCVNERGGGEDPEECHESCEALAAAPGDSVLAKRYAHAVALAKEGSADELLAMGAELPEYVKLNMDRGTVQLYDCKGEEVIANLRVMSTQ